MPTHTQRTPVDASAISMDLDQTRLDAAATLNDLDPRPVVRWTFLRRGKALTCEVDARGTESYDVCIVPHWDVSASVIETFTTASAALWRHAEISGRLREQGWLLARDSPGTESAPAVEHR